MMFATNKGEKKLYRFNDARPFFSLCMWMHADASVIKPLEYTERLANK